jgi:hypothetical protein
MTTRNLSGGKKQPAHRADNLAAIRELMSENVGASTSCNPKGLHSLYRDNFTFTFTFNNTNITAAMQTSEARIKLVPLHIMTWNFIW